MPTSEAAAAPTTERVPSSRERILLAAKRLFARNGYENTSTIAIARDAGTSESQLMKHFGSKQGLLEEILDRGWMAIVERVRALPADSPLPRRLVGMLMAIVIEMENDLELKELMALEMRRVRKDSRDVLLSRGYCHFSEELDSLLNQMHAQEQIRPELNLEALRAALIALPEGLLRDQVIASRCAFHASYSFDDMQRLLERVVPTLVLKSAIG